MGLRMAKVFLLAVVFFTPLNSCIQELELDEDENISYFLIDGDIVVGEQIQRLFIGRTNGVATASPSPLFGADVRVENYIAAIP